MVTSIWVFDDDNTVRFQQKLADGELYVPYSSYFSPEKISVTVPTEIKFHDIKFGSKPLKIAKTSWINYVFENTVGRISSLLTIFFNSVLRRRRSGDALTLLGVLGYIFADVMRHRSSDSNTNSSRRIALLLKGAGSFEF
jgi:hypothetical protein